MLALAAAAAAAAWAWREQVRRGMADELATGDAVPAAPGGPAPGNAATTVFTGVSVWLMVPALQPVIDRAAAHWGLSGHPAHVTLVYGIPGDEARARAAFARLRASLPPSWLLPPDGEAANTTRTPPSAAPPARSNSPPLLKPTRMAGGKSALFGHGYLDLFFQRSAPLDSLFDQVAAAMGWDRERESFAGAPHACLGYADPRLAAAMARGERQVLEWFPQLLEEDCPAEAVSLWSTRGTTADWVELDRIPFSTMHVGASQQKRR